MSFCTAINCMDGRVQLPVIKYLMKRFHAEYVDVISEPGPNLILAEQGDGDLVESIFRRVDISVGQHDSVGIAVMGHHDCAGNPAARDEQRKHTRTAIELIKQRYDNIPVIGLCVNENWEVSEIDE